jgi:hypothetical protein
LLEFDVAEWLPMLVAVMSLAIGIALAYECGLGFLFAVGAALFTFFAASVVIGGVWPWKARICLKDGDTGLHLTDRPRR